MKAVLGAKKFSDFKIFVNNNSCSGLFLVLGINSLNLVIPSILPSVSFISTLCKIFPSKTLMWSLLSPLCLIDELNLHLILFLKITSILELNFFLFFTGIRSSSRFSGKYVSISKEFLDHFLFLNTFIFIFLTLNKLINSNCSCFKLLLQ